MEFETIFVDEFGTVEDINGNKYVIDPFPQKITHQISVTDKPFKKGVTWQDEWRGREQDKETPGKIHLMVHATKYNIQKIEEDGNYVTIRFKGRKSYKKKEPKEGEPDPIYVELLTKANLHKDKMHLLIREVLSNLFTVQDLKKILQNKPEFVMDEHQMYLKSGGTAYRT